MTTDLRCYADNIRYLELFSPRNAAFVKRFKQAAQVSTLPPENVGQDWLPAQVRQSDLLILLGLGDGSRLRHLLEMQLPVLAIECEPAIWMRILQDIPLHSAIASGQLHLLLLPASSAISREISLRECVCELVEQLLQPARTLHFIETSSMSMQQDFYASARQSLLSAIGTINVATTQHAPDTAFDVTVISPRCAIFNDLAHCFSRLGLRTQLLQIPDQEGEWSASERQQALLSLIRQPSRLVVSRNRCLFDTEQPGDFPQPEALLPGAVAMWWWDVPNLRTHVDFRYPRGKAQSFAFARELLGVLPRSSHWLPPAARTPFVEAGEQAASDFIYPLCFVGQSRMQMVIVNLHILETELSALGAAAKTFAKQIKNFANFESLYRVLLQQRDHLLQDLSALCAACPAHAFYLRYLFDMALTGAFRIAAIERLLREKHELVVFGDDDWLKLPGMSERQFKGVCSPDELPALYRRSRINLNLNFMQVSSTVNPKVLDIAAAGGVALTDYRPELDLLYPDPAARPFAFKTLDQLSASLESLRGVALESHALAVRKHTLAEHTLLQRAHWLATHFHLFPAKSAG